MSDPAGIDVAGAVRWRRWQVHATRSDRRRTTGFVVAGVVAAVAFGVWAYLLS